MNIIPWESIDMKIRALLFGGLRHALNNAGGEIEVAGDATARDLLLHFMPDKIEREKWQDKICYAINQEHVKSTTRLNPGDEVALMPPMAGG